MVSCTQNKLTSIQTLLTVGRFEQDDHPDQEEVMLLHYFLQNIQLGH